MNQTRSGPVSYRLGLVEAELLRKDLESRLDEARLRCWHVAGFWALLVGTYGIMVSYSLWVAMESQDLESQDLWMGFALFGFLLALLGGLLGLPIIKLVWAQARLYRESHLVRPPAFVSERWKNRSGVRRAVEKGVALLLGGLVAVAAWNLIGTCQGPGVPSLELCQPEAIVPLVATLTVILTSAILLFRERRASLECLERVGRSLLLLVALWAVGLRYVLTARQDLWEDYVGIFLGAIFPALVLIWHRIYARRQARLAPLGDAYFLKRRLDKRAEAQARSAEYVELPLTDALRLAEIEEALIRRGRLADIARARTAERAEHEVVFSRAVQERLAEHPMPIRLAVRGRAHELAADPRPEAAIEDAGSGRRILIEPQSGLRLAYQIDAEARRVRILELGEAEAADG